MLIKFEKKGENTFKSDKAEKNSVKRGLGKQMQLPYQSYNDLNSGCKYMYMLQIKYGHV